MFTSSQVEEEGQVGVIYSADGPVNAEPFQYGNTITGGIIRLRHKDRMSDTAVMHETVHIMGFGHTCSWPTVMSTCLNATNIRSGIPTIWDVGYIQLLYRTHDLQRELDAPYGIMEAWQSIENK